MVLGEQGWALSSRRAGLQVPGGQVSAAAAAAAAGAPPTADPERGKLIQQQLVFLVHALKCQWREQANGEVRQCNVPHCRTMKNVMAHRTHCQAGKSCQVAHCASSRAIASHWKNCTRHNCPVCPKNAGDKRNPQSLLGSASAGLGSSLGGAVPGGQPSAPSLNPPSQFDPSSLERAYAALGLTYQGNQLQGQPSQPNMPNQGLQGQQGMRPLNPMGGNPMGVNGGVGVSAQSQQASLIQETMMHLILNVNSQGLTANPPSAPGMRKSWHEDITQDLRNYMVDKLLQAMFPNTYPAILKALGMEPLVAYVRKVEGDVYESANSKAEYYQLLVERICKIRELLEEKRRARLQKQGLGLGPPGMGQPPTGLPPKFSSDSEILEEELTEPPQKRQRKDGRTLLASSEEHIRAKDKQLADLEEHIRAKDKELEGTKAEITNQERHLGQAKLEIEEVKQQFKVQETLNLEQLADREEHLIAKDIIIIAKDIIIIAKDKELEETKTFQEEMKATLQCGVCKGLFIEPAMLNCAHSFCTYCIRKWCEEDFTTCPLCREPIRYQIRNLEMEKCMEPIVQRLSPDEKVIRDRDITKRADETRQTADRMEESPAQDVLSPSYSLDGVYSPIDDSTESENEEPHSWRH